MGELTSSGGSGGPQLELEKIVGTSAKSPRQFCIQNDLIAYTASGGVVVSRIDTSTGQIESQRFFCANSNYNGSSYSSANAYLNMAYDIHEETEVIKDQYGYPVNADPSVATGNSGTFGGEADTFSPGTDNDTSSPSKLKDRVRSIHCIAISPNRKLLAIGESGYQPRVLIYSLAPDSSKNPILLIYEHSFGINSVTFSPDSRYLCSLGFINDGYINVWKLNQSSAYLTSSNKCSAPINSVIWHENFLVTMGLRIIKVWKFDGPDSEGNNVPKPSVLKGKNVLLGGLINSNFIHGSILNSDELLVITSTQNLLLLKLNYDALTLARLETPSFEISTLLVDYESDLIWFGSAKSIKSISIASLNVAENSSSSDLRKTQSNDIFKSPTRGSPSERARLKDQSIQIVKIEALGESGLLYLNDEGILTYYDKKGSGSRVLTEPLIQNLGGVKLCSSGRSLIFSKSGLVRSLEEEGETSELSLTINLPENDLISNSLTAIEHTGKYLIYGDKYGNLYVNEPPDAFTSNIIYQTKAHSSNVNEIVSFQIGKYQVITTIARDRMIQFFYCNVEKGEFDILQTIPLHNGNLLEIKYADNKVYVCSSDRTISIHTIKEEDTQLKITQEKLITTKTTPLAMRIFGDDLVVSTNDKTIYVYSIDDSFALKRTLKLYNEKNNESVLVEDFVVIRNLILTSCADKSLRIFNYSTGKSYSVTWGHSESIMGLILRADNTLLSAGAEGCLLKWTLQESVPSEFPIRDKQVIENKEEDLDPVYTKVTRRIIPSIPKGRTDVKQSTKIELEDEKPSPSSSPRLTPATLRRMESRKSLDSGVPTRKSVSPVRPIALSKPILSPSKATRASLGHSSPARPLSPVRSPSKKPSMDFSSIRRPHVVLDGSPSPTKERATFDLSSTDRLLCELASIEASVAKEARKMSKDDKSRVHSKVAAIAKLLEERDLEGEMSEVSLERSDAKDAAKMDTTPKEETKKSDEEPDVSIMLEKYSERLVQIFERKLASRERIPMFNGLLGGKRINDVE